MTETPVRRLSIKGITIGAVVDIVATNIVLMPLGIYLAATIHLERYSREESAKVLAAAMKQDPVVYGIQIGLGALCSILGGYVAARIAGRSMILNGALSSILCVGFGVYTMIFSPLDTTPLITHLLFFVGSVGCGAAGGYLRQRMLKPAN